MGTASIALVYPIRRFHPARKTRSIEFVGVDGVSIESLVAWTSARETEKERLTIGWNFLAKAFMTSYCFSMKVDQLEKRDFAVSSIRRFEERASLMMASCIRECRTLPGIFGMKES